jgi:hypothetical protein
MHAAKQGRPTWARQAGNRQQAVQLACVAWRVRRVGGAQHRGRLRLADHGRVHESWAGHVQGHARAQQLPARMQRIRPAETHVHVRGQAADVAKGACAQVKEATHVSSCCWPSRIWKKQVNNSWVSASTPSFGLSQALQDDSQWWACMARLPARLESQRVHEAADSKLGRAVRGDARRACRRTARRPVTAPRARGH